MKSQKSTCDLHLHSKHSDRAVEWLLRRFDFPDSYSDPLRLHEILREKGRDFVTITDHNSIDGCLEIAHLPGVFISEEVTTYFPEDRCKIHLLVWGITEEQHREIERLRPSIFDLQAYLRGQEIAHAVAHPLYDINRKLGAAHVEKLILLFEHFERLNGLRDRRLGELLDFYLDRLTSEQITRLADKHGIEPAGKAPWTRFGVGGSDDHGGLFPGATYTETPFAKSPEEFLAHVRSGSCSWIGRAGTPLAVSHSLYNTAYHFVKSKFSRNVHGTTDLVEKMFSRFMEGKDPTAFSFADKLGFLAEGIVTGRIFELANPASSGLWKELGEYFNREELNERLGRLTRGVAEPERRAFLMANHVANELAFRFFNKFLLQISAGNFFESIQAISALAPIALSLSPYIYGLQTQSASGRWMRELCRDLTGGEIPSPLLNRKRAWFTDTLEDVNGVTTTIRKMTAAAKAAGRDVTIVTSRPEISIEGLPIMNFPPVGEFELPEYELQKLSFPPVLNILDWVQRWGFTEIIISTPGPIGLCGLLAAKMLGIRATGIYHTDFPQYVSILTDDSFFETLTWDFMHWFYSQLDLLLVNSEFYKQCWIQRGIPASRIEILPRGLDTDLFTVSRRDAGFWQAHGGADNRRTLLYVGRVSKEKDLDLLVPAWKSIKSAVPDVQMAFVGDGPYRTELAGLLPDAIFTGYLGGAELAAAYASSELFVFPSTTDTFGNVLLEAQACGLPAVVSDIGGPKELIRQGVDGFVTPALDAPAFADAVIRILKDPALRQSMSLAALDAVKDRNWQAAFEKFWALSPE